MNHSDLDVGDIILVDGIPTEDERIMIKVDECPDENGNWTILCGLAQKLGMPPRQLFDVIIDVAYANAHFENPDVTEESIRKFATSQLTKQLEDAFPFLLEGVEDDN